MPQRTHPRRVVLVVLDGFRPEAANAFTLTAFRRLSHGGAYACGALAGSPPFATTAMASVLTGVPPHHDGLTNDHFHLPRLRGGVRTLPRMLDDAGLPVSTFVRELPRLYRPLGRVVASRLGVRHPHFSGTSATEILDAARGTLQRQREGLIVLHWADAAVAGRAHGWASREYDAACHTIDATLDDLAADALLFDDPSTLLIGVAATEGESDAARAGHLEGRTPDASIPFFLAGWDVRPCRMGGPVTLLDIPRTIAWYLGVASPPMWTGRVLVEAFPHAKAA